MPRSTDRKGFDIEVRMSLLESDLDAFEKRLTSELTEFKAEIRRLADQQEASRKINVGVLVSVLTASLLIALNLIMFGWS